MIPFARVLKYGNKIAPKQAPLVYGAANAQFYFDPKTNKLYGMASNGNYIGLPTGSSQYTLCASNVKRVLSNVNGGASFFLYEDLDGKIWGVGNPNNLYGTGYSQVAVWTDYTSTFSNVNINDIKDVQCYYDYKTNVVMNNGDLWCMGMNDVTKNASFGNGTNVSSPGVLVKVTTDVAKASGNMVLKTNGELFITGTNAKYQYGNGTTIGSNSLTKLVNGVKDITIGYTCNYYLDVNGRLNVTGTALNGSLGNEMGTGTSYIVTGWTLIDTNVESMMTCIGNISLHYSKTDGKLYFTGYNPNGSGGVGSGSTNVRTPMICNPQIGWDSSCIFSRSNANMIYSKPDGLYFSGAYYGSGLGQENNIVPFSLPS